MSMLSIVTDPLNLFDYEKGIYVTGKDYADYVGEYRENLYFQRGLLVAVACKL